MKVILFTLCLAVVVFGQDDYEPIDESFDISQVLRNDRLLQSYSRCLLNKGPCTPEVKKVRDRLPEALATRCAKCTASHKRMAKQLVQELKRSQPKIWQQLVAYYDPQGKYSESFQDFLKD